MQGNQAVVDYMNELLSGELAARDQYFIHSRLYSEWGYTKLLNVSITRWKKKPHTPKTSSDASWCWAVRRKWHAPNWISARTWFPASKPTCKPNTKCATLWKRHQTVRRGSRLCYARPDGCPTERHRRRPRTLVGTAAAPDRADWRRQLLPKPTVIRIRNKRSPYERRPFGYPRAEQNLGLLLVTINQYFLHARILKTGALKNWANISSNNQS